MIRLNVGFNRKVGEPGYGSRGASVNLDVELPSGEVQDVERLRERIRRLFQIARASVAEELEGRPGSQQANPASAGRPVCEEPPARARREQGPGRRRDVAYQAVAPQEPVEAAGVSQALLGAGRRSPERSVACA